MHSVTEFECPGINSNHRLPTGGIKNTYEKQMKYPDYLLQELMEINGLIQTCRQLFKNGCHYKCRQ